MRSTLLLVTLLAAAVAVSAQQPEEPLPCYQEKCSPLITVLNECKITVDATTGNINFPVEANTTETDKCLCKQTIVDAYDPCFTCGAESQKVQDRFSTLKLVDSCNANFGAGTVKMPGSAAAGSILPGVSSIVAATAIVASLMAML